MADGNQAEKLPVVVFADFICPYSYIAQEQVDQLIRDYDVEPLWLPHWLHPEIPPEGAPMAPSADPDRRKATMAWLKEMAPEKAANLRFPGKRQFSFFAFEGMEYAQDHGVVHPFRSAVFDALWLEGKDIGDIATLQECADKVGLDGEEFGRAIFERAYAERALENIKSARRAGIGTTPTVILGRTKIVGWHYYEVFQTVMEKQGIPLRTERRSVG